jgi:hypothetical protein
VAEKNLWRPSCSMLCCYGSLGLTIRRGWSIPKQFPLYSGARPQTVVTMLNSPNSTLMNLLGFSDSDPSAIGRTTHYHLTVTNSSHRSDVTHRPRGPP